MVITDNSIEIDFILTSGDSWDDFTIEVMENGELLPLDGIDVVMEVKKDPGDVKPFMVLSTMNGLLRTEENKITCGQQPEIVLRPGLYIHTIRLFGGGKKATYYRGRITVN